MNVAFLLTPKSEVAWLPAEATVQEALDHMEISRHTAVPILDGGGLYVGTVTDGDLLRHIRHAEGAARDTALATTLLAVERRMQNRPVRIDADLETLVARAIVQSFVPVIDDRDVFVGIVRRQHIFEHTAKRAGLLPP